MVVITMTESIVDVVAVAILHELVIKVRKLCNIPPRSLHLSRNSFGVHVGKLGEVFDFRTKVGNLRVHGLVSTEIILAGRGAAVNPPLFFLHRERDYREGARAL